MTDYQSRQEVPAGDPRPTFQTPARPLEVPAALRLLPPLTEILTRPEFAGTIGMTACGAAEYIAVLEDIMRRQAEGLFTVAEAAQVLTDARPGADVLGMLKKMHKAYRDGKLPIRDPGDQLRKVIADFHRDHSDLVTVSDIDAWLTKDGAGYLFPPAAVAESPAVTAAAPETPKQLRKTWRDVAWAYVVERLRADKFATAVELNHALHAEAGDGCSPFDKGEGRHRGSLWVREIGQPLALKTIQNKWAELRADAFGAA